MLTSKSILTPDMIDDMRKCYRECMPYLLTSVQTLGQTSIIRKAKIEALKSIAKSLFGINLIEVKIAKKISEGDQ